MPTGYVNATWTLASLKIPLTGVLADWSKTDWKTFEAPLIGYEQGFGFETNIILLPGPVRSSRRINSAV